MIKFEDWEANKLKDEEFVAAAGELEPGYQIARLRIKEGLTQKELAEKVGTRPPAQGLPPGAAGKYTFPVLV